MNRKESGRTDTRLSSGLKWTYLADVKRAGVLLVECCFTSTQTVGLLGTGARDAGHLDFHTAPELCAGVRDNLLLNVHGGEKAY